MNNTPIFQKIDLKNWERKEYFDHYLNKVKCSYSITAEIEISELLPQCKKNNIKLFTAMTYLITTAVNQIAELRTCFNQKGELGIWDFMSPSYTVFQDDSKTFTNIWTRYDRNFQIFNRDLMLDIETYSNVKKFLAKENEPENVFPISCIPWVNFTGFNLNIKNDSPYLCPIFTLGQFRKEQNKIFIPLAAQLHHATCDGWHAGMLFNHIQELASNSQSWFAFEMTDKIKGSKK